MVTAMSYTACHTDERAFAHAADVVGNTVIDQTRTWYDSAGRTVARLIFACPVP